MMKLPKNPVGSASTTIGKTTGTATNPVLNVAKNIIGKKARG